MNSSNLPLAFKFYGISPWELEVIYSLLHSLFKVEENPTTEQDGEFTTMVDITFPLEFNDAFFKWFGSTRWEKTKEILKEMKRRRGGGKSMIVYIKFSGNPNVKFTIDSDERRMFDAAIDKMNFVLELLQYHLDPKKMPKSITEVSYGFDETSGRWNIDHAIAGDERYSFSKNEWTII